MLAFGWIPTEGIVFESRLLTAQRLNTICCIFTRKLEKGLPRIEIIVAPLYELLPSLLTKSAKDKPYLRRAWRINRLVMWFHNQVQYIRTRERERQRQRDRARERESPIMALPVLLRLASILLPFLIFNSSQARLPLDSPTLTLSTPIDTTTTTNITKVHARVLGLSPFFYVGNPTNNLFQFTTLDMIPNPCTLWVFPPFHLPLTTHLIPLITPTQTDTNPPLPNNNRRSPWTLIAHGTFTQDIASARLRAQLTSDFSGDPVTIFIIEDEFCDWVDVEQDGRESCPPKQGEAVMRYEAVLMGGIPEVSVCARLAWKLIGRWVGWLVVLLQMDWLTGAISY